MIESYQPNRPVFQYGSEIKRAPNSAGSSTTESSTDMTNCMHCNVRVLTSRLKYHWSHLCRVTVPRVPCELCQLPVPQHAMDEHHTYICRQAIAPCAVCGTNVTRAGLADHLARICRRYSVRCTFCGRWFSRTIIALHYSAHLHAIDASIMSRSISGPLLTTNHNHHSSSSSSTYQSLNGISLPPIVRSATLNSSPPPPTPLDLSSNAIHGAPPRSGSFDDLLSSSSAPHSDINSSRSNAGQMIDSNWLVGLSGLPHGHMSSPITIDMDMPTPVQLTSTLSDSAESRPPSVMGDIPAAPPGPIMLLPKSSSDPTSSPNPAGRMTFTHLAHTSTTSSPMASPYASSSSSSSSAFATPARGSLSDLHHHRGAGGASSSNSGSTVIPNNGGGTSVPTRPFVSSLPYIAAPLSSVTYTERWETPATSRPRGPSLSRIDSHGSAARDVPFGFATSRQLSRNLMPAWWAAPPVSHCKKCGERVLGRIELPLDTLEMEPVKFELINDEEQKRWQRLPNGHWQRIKTADGHDHDEDANMDLSIMDQTTRLVCVYVHACSSSTPSTPLAASAARATKQPPAPPLTAEQVHNAVTEALFEAETKDERHHYIDDDDTSTALITTAAATTSSNAPPLQRRASYQPSSSVSQYPSPVPLGASSSTPLPSTDPAPLAFTYLGSTSTDIADFPDYVLRVHGMSYSPNPGVSSHDVNVVLNVQ
jgi:hypothetical protein